MNNKLNITYIGKELKSTHRNTLLADIYEVKISKNLISYQLTEDFINNSDKGFFEARETVNSSIYHSFCAALEQDHTKDSEFNGCFLYENRELAYIRVIFEDGLDQEFVTWGIRSLVIDYNAKSQVLSLMG
ncbi:MAG: hypothetical protein R3Y09_02285 [Clostridia bacterium]